MSRLAVEPDGLTQAAQCCDGIVGDLGAIRAQLRRSGSPDTGRADSRALVQQALDELVSSLDRLALAAAADADHLRVALESYRAADSCLGP